MYQINVCSPIWSSSLQLQLKVIRFIFITVLLLLYLMYLIIKLILRKSVQNLTSGENPNLHKAQVMKKKWERQYMMMFGDHIVSVGFVICFSPYIFQIILSILYLILRVAYEIRLHKYSHSIKQIKTILRLINLALLISAMVGLSRSGFDETLQNCRDPDYRYLLST